MGDFNTTCDEGATANLVANGIAHDANGFFTDWQPTRHPGQRCIDYALVSPRVHPQTKQQHPGPRDHDLITYTFPVGPSPPGYRRPQLRGINHEHTITPQQFQDRWNQQQFQQHLDNHDTTAAWTMLSDVAEDLLSADNSHGLRRSTLWQPIQHTQPAKHTLSKQTSSNGVFYVHCAQRGSCSVTHAQTHRRRCNGVYSASSTSTQTLPTTRWMNSSTLWKHTSTRRLNNTQAVASSDG